MSKFVLENDEYWESFLTLYNDELADEKEKLQEDVLKEMKEHFEQKAQIKKDEEIRIKELAQKEADKIAQRKEEAARKEKEEKAIAAAAAAALALAKVKKYHSLELPKTDGERRELIDKSKKELLHLAYWYDEDVDENAEIEEAMDSWEEESPDDPSHARGWKILKKILSAVDNNPQELLTELKVMDKLVKPVAECVAVLVKDFCSDTITKDYVMIFGVSKLLKVVIQDDEDAYRKMLSSVFGEFAKRLNALKKSKKWSEAGKMLKDFLKFIEENKKYWKVLNAAFKKVDVENSDGSLSETISEIKNKLKEAKEANQDKVEKDDAGDQEMDDNKISDDATVESDDSSDEAAEEDDIRTVLDYYAEQDLPDEEKKTQMLSCVSHLISQPNINLIKEWTFDGDYEDENPTKNLLLDAMQEALPNSE